MIDLFWFLLGGISVMTLMALAVYFPISSLYKDIANAKRVLAEELQRLRLDIEIFKQNAELRIKELAPKIENANIGVDKAFPSP